MAAIGVTLAAALLVTAPRWVPRPAAGAIPDGRGTVTRDPSATQGASTRGPSAAAEPVPDRSAATIPGDPAAITYPERGRGTWSVAPGRSRIAGSGGQLMRFRVAVERGITNVDAADFADTAFGALADPRGWTGDGRWRLQRVGPGEPYDFTLYLATPATRDELCGSGYDRYTSCRNGDRVVVNVARWVHGVPNYGAPLDVYRQYVVNHEVGHQLGHGHEKCPARGRPAPLMQQQTLGLHGCRANPWRMIDGSPYSGPSGAYDDPVPVV